MKKAVIVAAGKSSRLYPRTLNMPKSLLKIGETQIIKRSLDYLESVGITDIAIVTGYCSDMFKETLGDKYAYIYNPFYEHCNNMGSLWFGRDFIAEDDFVYLHSDIMYDRKVLEASLKGFKDSAVEIDLVTDFKKTDEEAMKVLVNDRNMLLESSKQIPLDKAAGEWIGMAHIRCSRKLFKSIEEIMKEGHLNVYDTFCFTRLAQSGTTVYCSSTEKLDWTEIDFEEDFLRAEQVFGNI